MGFKHCCILRQKRSDVSLWNLRKKCLPEIFQLNFCLSAASHSFNCYTNVQRQLIQLKIHISSTSNVSSGWGRNFSFIYVFTQSIITRSTLIANGWVECVCIHSMPWYFCGRQIYATYLIQTIYQCLPFLFIFCKNINRLKMFVQFWGRNWIWL